MKRAKCKTPSASSVCSAGPRNLTSPPTGLCAGSDLSLVPSATSKTPKPRKKSSPPASVTDSSRTHPSSLMCEMSAAEALKALRRQLPRVSRASRFRLLVKGLEKRTADICLARSSEWLMKLDWNSCSWKTCQGCLPLYETNGNEPSNQLQYQTYLDSWPKAAFVANGYLWPLKTSEVRMVANAGGPAHGGNWNTPNVWDHANPRSPEALEREQQNNRPGRTGAPTLREQVLEGENWPTPNAIDKDAHGGPRESQGQTSVANAVAVWSTPQARDHRSGDADRTGRFDDGSGKNLNDEILKWSTPKVSRGGYTYTDGDPNQPRLTLDGEVRNWATPRGEDSQACGPHSASRLDSLNNQVKQWPTPCATDDIRGENEFDGKRGQTLTGAVRGQPWPSPRMNSRTGACEHGEGGADLQTAVIKKWATPTSDDSKNAASPSQFSRGQGSDNLNVQVVAVLADPEARLLNPDWEEILMGWFIGWTDWTKPCAGIFPGWPMGQGSLQWEYEPARTVKKDSVPNRTKRVEMCGLGVVPQCAEAAILMLLQGAISEE